MSALHYQSDWTVSQTYYTTHNNLAIKSKVQRAGGRGRPDVWRDQNTCPTNRQTDGSGQADGKNISSLPKCSEPTSASRNIFF